MTSLAATQRGADAARPGLRDGSGRGLLDRDDLLRMLDRAVTKRVTVISAPPGSGKTSLLRAWVHRLSASRRVAFVTVDRDQQDAQGFWSAVLNAIRDAASIEAEGQGAETALNGDQLVDAVVAELAERVDPAVLVIDDLHELKSADTGRQLERFLATLPSSARVVLSSRRDPPIRLHQLRLADELAEIRADDLGFTESETRALLAASGISLSERGVAALHQRTEGWAAGLRLAVISLRDHPEPERFLANFSGTNRAIGEYLMAEMLQRQPSGVQGMLLRTSLVDRLNGELADLLVGRPGSEQALLELEDANAFVVSLDAERTWFRYHHLLADFLRLELRRRFADEVPDLHRRAARWFGDRGDEVESIRHLLAAGDWPDAARLVADHSIRWVLEGRAGTIRTVLHSFPQGVSADHPDLALAHAADELNLGRMEEAAAQLAVTDSYVQSAPSARRRRLEVAIASLRLAMARRSGQFSEVIQQVRLLDASIADGSSEPTTLDSELRAVALMNLGIVETWSGQFAEAERHVSEGARLAEAIGRPYIEVACRAYQAFPSPLVSLAIARERGHQAFAEAERHGLNNSPVLAPAFGAIACIAVWTGEFDEGERWLRRGWDVVQAEIDPATAVLLHMVTGMLHAGRGEHGPALKALTAAARAQSLLTGVHILATVIAEWLAAAQVRLGMSDEACATLNALSAEQQRMHGVILARTHISLAEGDPATALAVLGDAWDMKPPPGFPAYALVEAHVLAGLAHLALGDLNGAAASTEDALAAAEPDRLIFPFALFSAAELVDVLPRYQTAHGALLTDVLDLVRGGPALRSNQERLPQPDELSPSELRVLRFLPTNLTRPEIANELGLSINTVNTHIRNLYAKLGVTDRSAAVERARQLRLLSGRTSTTLPK